MAIRAVKAQTAENQFNNLLVTMGLNVDEAVGKAIAALLHSNSHIVAGVMESAVAIQELELKLDQAVFSALERGDLPRSEVRRMTSIVNISKDLARLGKLAANLGRKVTEVGKHNDHEDFSRLQPLAIAVSHLCRQTLRSLTRLDLVLARSAAAGGASVDAYRDYVLRNLNSQQRATSEQDDLHLIFASRCLEQLADHAAHLAESLVDFLASEPEPEQCHTMAS
ncbi:MAG TPA: PhoU domain-containing protein [Candidatus Angelobacter sp.]|jgi:phosphate transport system protein|nr:PhoU domain-containing protein [Candidatus Angelobacter sp.]